MHLNYTYFSIIILITIIIKDCKYFKSFIKNIWSLSHIISIFPTHLHSISSINYSLLLTKISITIIIFITPYVCIFKQQSSHLLNSNTKIYLSIVPFLQKLSNFYTSLYTQIDFHFINSNTKIEMFAVITQYCNNSIENKYKKYRKILNSIFG